MASPTTNRYALITDLPPEILNDIISEVASTDFYYDSGFIVGDVQFIEDHRWSIGDLRITCKALDSAIQPFIFSTIRVDLHWTRLERVTHQLKSLATENGPWCRFTKSLVLSNLDPRFDFRSTKKRKSEYEAYESPKPGPPPPDEHCVEEIEKLSCEFLSSGIKVLQELTGVMWDIRKGDPVQTVLPAIGSLAQLGNLDLTFTNAEMARELSFQAISGLRRLHVKLQSPLEPPEDEFEWTVPASNLLVQLQGVIERSPGLTHLSIDGTSCDPDERLDEGLCISVPAPSADEAPLNCLKSLFFCGPHLWQLLLPVARLRSLAELDFQYSTIEQSPSLWSSLQESGARLRKISITAALPALMDYLASYSSTLTHIEFNFNVQQLSAPPIGHSLYSSILDQHCSTLVSLTIRSPFLTPDWCVSIRPIAARTTDDGSEPSAAPAQAWWRALDNILRCKRLEVLTITLLSTEILESETPEGRTVTCIPQLHDMLKGLLSELRYLKRLDLYAQRDSSLRGGWDYSRLDPSVNRLMLRAISSLVVRDKKRLGYFILKWHRWDFALVPRRQYESPDEVTDWVLFENDYY